MNRFDRENLEWLRTCNQEEFEEWMAEAEVEDICYAINLFKECKQDLLWEKSTLVDSIEDTTQAIDVLRKFTLKG
jgi:D-serine deaminase-like pyridoxal phosphate-dependent protein